MTPEGKIQKQITSYLKQNNIFYFKVITSSVGGIPDLFMIIHNKPLFIEVKAAKGRLSALQEYQIKRIRENGVRAEVVYNFEEFLSILNDILMTNK